jgi:hypothetical protein
MPRRINRPNSPYPRAYTYEPNEHPLYLNQISGPQIQSDDDQYRESTPDFNDEINQSSYDEENYQDTYERNQDVDHYPDQTHSQSKGEDYGQDEDYGPQPNSHNEYVNPEEEEDYEQGPNSYNEYIEPEDIDYGPQPNSHNESVNPEEEEDYEQGPNSYDDYVDQTQEFHKLRHRRQHDVFGATGNPQQEGHHSDNDLFFHQEWNQVFHEDCSLCQDYIAELEDHYYQN